MGFYPQDKNQSILFIATLTGHIHIITGPITTTVFNLLLYFQFDASFQATEMEVYPQ